MLILTFGAIFSSPALWYFDILPIMYAFLLPWVAIFGASVYLMIFGDHVIPSETYRKVRSGEWEYNE